VRRVDGRVVYLTEAALAVFEAERRRHADEREWTAARLQWLHLATTVKASPARRKRLADAPLSAAVVEASRALYLATAEKAVRAARHEKRWGDVGTIRREQAAALYSEAGSPVPPPAEIAELHRDGMAAVLRSLALIARDVEIVSMACCRPCREDDGRTFRIADELHVARLPHAGCPHGLCGCEWWPAVVQPAKRRRRTAPRSASPVSGAGTGGSDTPVSGVGTDERDPEPVDPEPVDPEPVDAIASGTAGGRPDGSSPRE
jgi:hypothetical protein